MGVDNLIIHTLIRFISLKGEQMINLFIIPFFIIKKCKFKKKILYEKIYTPFIIFHNNCY